MSHKEDYIADPYPHLDVMTNYSMNGSMVSLDDLRNFSFVGVTDENTFAWYKLQQVKGVNPIFGIRSDGYIHYAKNDAGLKLFYKNTKRIDYDFDVINICLDINLYDHTLANQYIAIRRINKYSDRLNIEAHQFAIENGFPMVAINSPRFIEPDDYIRQRIAFNVFNKSVMNSHKDTNEVSSSQYFLTAKQMKSLFRDLPSAIDNAYAISEMCTARISGVKPITPSFTGDRKKDDEVLKKSLGKMDKRTKFEFDVIKKMGFSGYFLIVADFIDWARKNEIPVGCGRGSGAGSIVAYKLHITTIDPIKYDLLFERFLNPDRVSLPDFDVDFCPEGRDKVIAYVKNKYGKQNVAVISTIGTLADVSATQAASRAYGTGISGSTMIKDCLSAKLPMDNILETVYAHGKSIEGIPKNLSKHAAGVVLYDNPVHDVCPVYNSVGNCTGLEMKEVEKLGLVKFDFLGLKTLTQIKNTCNLIGMSEYDIPEYLSKKECKMLANGFTTGCFQIESHGMKELITAVKPTDLEQLSDCIALYRPGPMESGMMTDYIFKCQGLSPESIFDGLGVDNRLESTKGQLIYQEQVMQIARDLTDFTLSEADLLRRAMGKKIKKEMEDVRKKFLKRTKINKKKAEKIFDAIEKFAGYGFNKSHSICYATICHHTSWLKAHYPVEFFAATLSLNMGDEDTLMMMISDARKEHGIKFLRPTLKKSKETFTVEGDNIRCGLRAIKHVSTSVCTRLEDGVDFKTLPKQAKEHLEYVGATGSSADYSSREEIKGFGFPFMKPPVDSQAEYYIHKIDFLVSKKGNPFAKLIVVNKRCHMSELLIFGDTLFEYKSILDEKIVIGDVIVDKQWIKSIGYTK